MMGSIDPSLSKHFVITEARLEIPNDWHELGFSGYNIYKGPDLRAHEIIDQAGERQGWVIGYVIGQEGLLDDGTPISLHRGDKDPVLALDGWAGRYIALAHLKPGAEPVLITDAGGLLPAVYSKVHRTVASTPTILADLLHLPVDKEIAQLFQIPEQHGWMPFGLTQIAGVKRLLPNFSLSLETFSTFRFWPSGTLVQQSFASANEDSEDLIRSIFYEVRRSVHSLLSEPHAVQHLTAGFDSRMILAAAIGAQHKRPFITVAIPSVGARIDVLMAAKLANMLGFTHEIRAFLQPSADDIAEWQFRSGRCISDAVEQLSTTLKSWKREEIQITGTCGEVGRAFYWSDADIDAAPPTPTQLLRRIGMPDAPRLLDESEAWLATLPKLPTPLLWDLTYIEQRLGCWAGPSAYGSIQRVPSMSPFNSRSIYRKILRTPEQLRCNNIFAKLFISTYHQELLNFEPNVAIGIYKLLFPINTIKSLLPKSAILLLKRTRDIFRSTLSR